MSLPPYSTLDDLIDIYDERLNWESKNRERIKKFYNDDESFDTLMNRLIDKDFKRFEHLVINSEHLTPDPWRILYTILDIVQNDGEEVPPFDTLTRSLLSRTLMYYGWTFSWVHGEGTLISIFNRKDELVYRF
jgi:hypothetical protein